MNYKYKDTKEWKMKGLKSLGSAALAVFSNILTVLSLDEGPWLIGFIQTATIIITITAVLSAIHFFTRPEKDYISVDDQGILIDQGPLRGKKDVPLERISKIGDREEVLVEDQKAETTGLINDVEKEKSLVIEQHNGKEALIDAGNLTDEDVHRLKQEVKGRVGPTVEIL